MTIAVYDRWNWLREFVASNGGRLIFMILYCLSVLVMYLFDMEEEAKAGLLMLSGILINKARGNNKQGG